MRLQSTNRKTKLTVDDIIRELFQVSCESNDNDDRKLFRQVIGKVQPLKTNKAHLHQNSKTKPAPRKRLAELQPADVEIKSEAAAELNAGDILSYIGPGLQKKVLRRLRSGLFEIEAQLDLHGLTAREAKQQVTDFIQHSSARQLRCVHIIHGKGYRSSDQRPVLKNELNFWLRQHSNVLAFCSSTPADGGTGAVYVYLARS